MTPNTPQVGVTPTSHYFWRKLRAKTRRMSYPALKSVVWESQKFITIREKHVYVDYIKCSLHFQTLVIGHEGAELILRVDDILKCAPRQRAPDHCM